MQRRSFLGALLGLAAAPVLAKLAPAFEPPAETFSEAPSILKPRSLGVIPGSGRLYRVSAYVPGDVGIARAPAPLPCNICRMDGGVLLHFMLDPNSAVSWVTSVGHKVIFTEDAPLVLEAPPEVALILTHSDLVGNEFAATVVKSGTSTTTPFRPTTVRHLEHR